MRNGHTALSPRNIGFAQGEAEAIGGPFWIPRMGFDLDSMGRFGFDLDSIVPVWIVLELNSILRLSLCWCDSRF